MAQPQVGSSRSFCGLGGLKKKSQRCPKCPDPRGVNMPLRVPYLCHGNGSLPHSGAVIQGAGQRAQHQPPAAKRVDPCFHSRNLQRAVHKTASARRRLLAPQVVSFSSPTVNSKDIGDKMSRETMLLGTSASGQPLPNPLRPMPNCQPYNRPTAAWAWHCSPQPQHSLLSGWLDLSCGGFVWAAGWFGSECRAAGC